jgi:hypothetical protein
LILWYNLDNFYFSHLCVTSLLFGVLSKLHLRLDLKSLVHAYLLNVYSMACFAFVDPIYGGNSIKSYID